jgi:transposase
MARDAFPTPHDWKEGRRLRAWALARQGWPQHLIAAALGVTPGAVSQWLKRARTGGVAALRRRTAPGAPPKLTPAQRAEVPALLAWGAEAFGFRGGVWTAPRVAWLIEAHFGVRYHPAHVSRLMRALRWTPQRPLQRATQRDEAAIKRWWAEHWPRLKRVHIPLSSPAGGA